MLLGDDAVPTIGTWELHAPPKDQARTNVHVELSAYLHAQYRGWIWNPSQLTTSSKENSMACVHYLLTWHARVHARFNVQLKRFDQAAGLAATAPLQFKTFSKHAHLPLNAG